MRKNHNILIADHESIVTTDLMDRLNKWGYNVFISDGDNTVTKDLIHKNNPDAVIIDDDYPVMEAGIKTAVEISQQHRVGIILLCAWMNEEIERISADLDSFCCLSKPYKDKELQKSLKRILKNQKN